MPVVISLVEGPPPRERNGDDPTRAVPARVRYRVGVLRTVAQDDTHVEQAGYVVRESTA
jgi:hypothetical protein